MYTHTPRHQVSLCCDDVLSVMSEYNVNSALHATKKLLDNDVSREAFLQKLRSVITDPDHGVL